ncbi:MAG: hypothetical protein EPN17_04815 [Methylobacter sp.]|nr:MAG: hypothetical protein EPN17_04815 [Methylobacter sp.]
MSAGSIITDLGGTDIIKTVSVLGSGKILAFGASNGYFAFTRYNADGSLDTSFYDDGKWVDGQTPTVTVNSVIGLSDGKFLSAGTDGNNDLLLMRFNDDASLDTSFDDDGKVTTDLGGIETATSVTVQNDGKILLAGTSDGNFALVRYNADGSLDNSFNASGKVNHAPSGEVFINGNAVKGQTLTASNTLADADGLGAISYQWRANGVNIGQGDSYTLTNNDIGKTITATAKYTDSSGTAESVISAATATVINIEQAGVSIIGSDFVTSEAGDTAVFSVKLNAAPTRDVSMTFTSSDATEGTVTTSTLTFTSVDWSTAQTFTVVGKDDTPADGNIAYQVTGSINTMDVKYNGLTISPILLTNIDNDVPGQTIYGDVDGQQNDVITGTTGGDKIYGRDLGDDLSGRLGNDQVYGGYGNDLLFGEEGDDKLYGEQDNDYMDGGTGNDTLDGGAGADTLIGGAGNDTYYLGYDAKDVITEKGLSTDIDTVIVPYQLTRYTLPTGIEKGALTESTLAGNLIGNSANNTLTGNGGDNLLSGAAGRDLLLGDMGNDVLLGGSGNDTLSGGAGEDIFKFDSALTANTDTITDFSVIDDTIQLENAIFTKLGAAGLLNADNFVKAEAPSDINDYLIYNPATGALTYDADGADVGVGVQIAVLGVNLALTYANFVVI